MKNLLFILTLTVVCLWSILSCQPNRFEEFSVDERNRIEDTIRNLVMVIEEAMQNLDLDGSFNLMSDNADFVLG